MTDDQARQTVQNMLRVMGHRESSVARVNQLTRRELSQGVAFATRLAALVDEVTIWMGCCADRMLQDQSTSDG